jgi:hypothetical protein
VLILMPVFFALNEGTRAERLILALRLGKIN